jgi:hypothetical protein
MRLGFNADGASGYHGYEWRHVLPVADLHVWCLMEVPEEEEGLALECIEAEVVFLYRQSMGQWPRFQTDIHFHESREQDRNLAAELFGCFRNAGA